MVVASYPATAATNPNANIAIVFSTGGLGDLSFNDAANAGKIKAETDFTGINVDTAEPASQAEINSAIESFASSTEIDYDLIIGIGFTATDGINASATLHPDKNFMIVDSVVPLSNVANVIFAEHEGSFLAGAMAAMVSTTEDIGFLGGLDITLINKFLAGYAQGARYINPDINIRVAYSPDPSNPWGDLAGGQNVANSFIELGSDVIYAAAGGTGLGVMAAAKEKSTADKKIYAIGVDSNQDYIEKGYVLTSMINRVDVAVYNQIKAVVDGTWAGNGDSAPLVLDLAADGVGITDMEFTQTEANADYNSTTTRMEKVDEIKADIIAGKITVDEALADDFTYVFEKVDEDLSDLEDLPLNAFFLFALIAIPVFRKIKK